MRQVQIHRSARAEIARAMRYYEMRQRGLGLDFSVEFDKTVDRIRANPHAGTPLNPKVRRRFLDGFPFAVLYSLPPGKIRVLAVMHLSRRPDYWKGRR